MIGKVSIAPLSAVLFKDDNKIFAPNPYVKLQLDI